MKLLFPKEKKYYLIFTIISVWGIIGINQYFFSGDNLGHESIMNIFWAASIFVLLLISYNITFKTRIYGYSLGFLFSLCMVTGKVLYMDNSLFSFFFPAKNFINEIISIIGFTGFLGSLISILFAYLSNLENEKKDNKLWKIFRIPFLGWTSIFFLSWFPCYMAYYPGIYSYDMDDLTTQALGTISDITKFHPPLHTLIWKAFLSLQNHVGIEAITLYSLTQMILLAIVFSRLIRLLVKKNYENWIIIGSILFFALNPVIALFSFIPTKDVYFAITFMNLGIELWEFASCQEAYMHSSYCCLRLCITILLCCLFRNNAVYALVLYSFIMLFALRKDRKKLLGIFACAFFCFFFISKVVYGAIGIQEGNEREILSVPIQQIANVVTLEEDTLSDEEKEHIDQFIPYDSIAENYNPRFADPVKQNFQTDTFRKNKADFFILWFQLFTKHPGNYINAFLSLNLPYWYPDASSKDEYSKRKYIETFIYDYDSIGYTFERNSKFPQLYDKYERVANYKAFQKVPIVSNLFSISTPVWMLITCIFILLSKQKKKLILILLPSLLIWLTFMAGPVSNFRYIFPIFIQYPLFAAIALQPSKNK